MAKKRIPAVDSGGKPYRGVYVRETLGPDDKPMRTFYIVYRKDGRVVEEKAGRATSKFRARDASLLRLRRIKGEETNTDKRRRLAQELQEARKAEEAAWTLQKVFNKYLEARGEHSSRAQDESRWRKHLAPLFADKDPASLIPLNIDALKKAIRDGGYSDSTMKNVLELFRRLLNFARDRELCPVANVKVKIPKVDNERTEFLTPGQIDKLMEALDREPDIYIVGIVKLALLTGMRKGEILKLEWQDVDFRTGFLTLRNPKGGKTERIPMNQGARELLKSLPKKDGSPFVFPGKKGEQRKDISKPLRRIRRNADLPSDFRMMHGLRHTFASLLASSGQVDLLHLSQLLTHKSTLMTERYSHLRDESLKRASAVILDSLRKEGRKG